MPHGFTPEEWHWFEENRQGCYLVPGRIVATNDPNRPYLVEVDLCPFCEQTHYHGELEHGFRRPPCRFEDLPPRMFLSTNDLPDYYVAVSGLQCPMHEAPSEAAMAESRVPEMHEVLRRLRLVQHGIDELRGMVRRLLEGPEQVF